MDYSKPLTPREYQEDLFRQLQQLNLGLEGFIQNDFELLRDEPQCMMTAESLKSAIMDFRAAQVRAQRDLQLKTTELNRLSDLTVLFMTNELKRLFPEVRERVRTRQESKT